jgi:PleD family two-component response regulator
MVIHGQLAVLVVECSDAAAELAVGALENGVCLCVRWRRVADSRGDDCCARRGSLGHRACAHRNLAFDAFTTLAVLGASGVQVPLIVVSGESGKETPIAAIHAGAADFVSRDHVDYV